MNKIWLVVSLDEFGDVAEIRAAYSTFPRAEDVLELGEDLEVQELELDSGTGPVPVARSKKGRTW